MDTNNTHPTREDADAAAAAAKTAAVNILDFLGYGAKRYGMCPVRTYAVGHFTIRNPDGYPPPGCPDEYYMVEIVFLTYARGERLTNSRADKAVRVALAAAAAEVDTQIGFSVGPRGF